MEIISGAVEANTITTSMGESITSLFQTGKDLFYTGNCFHVSSVISSFCCANLTLKLLSQPSHRNNSFFTALETRAFTVSSKPAANKPETGFYLLYCSMQNIEFELTFFSCFLKQL